MSVDRDARGLPCLIDGCRLWIAVALEYAADALARRANALERSANELERSANELERRIDKVLPAPPSSADPPTGASFLLDLCLPKVDREVIPGDLAEEFTTCILPKYGVRRARLWFWMQTVRTVATRNPVCRWILVGRLVRIGEWIFRKIGG
jgi:hypothetical protein